MSKAVLTALLEHPMCPYQRSLLFFRMRSRSSMPSCASCSVDLLVTTCLVLLHCRSVWSLLCHFAADAGGWALLMAKLNCTHGHVSWKRGGGKRELVSATWISSRRLSYVLWLKAHNHRLLRACFLGSKRELLPPACQAQLGLPSVVCHLRVCSSLALCTPVRVLVNTVCCVKVRTGFSLTQCAA